MRGAAKAVVSGRDLLRDRWDKMGFWQRIDRTADETADRFEGHGYASGAGRFVGSRFGARRSSPRNRSS